MPTPAPFGCLPAFAILLMVDEPCIPGIPFNPAPALILFLSLMPGFAFNIAATVVPLAFAILPKVSPFLIV